MLHNERFGDDQSCLKSINLLIENVPGLVLVVLLCGVDRFLRSSKLELFALVLH